MQQEIVKLSARFDKRVLSMASTEEQAIYARCFIDTTASATHRLASRWVEGANAKAPRKLELYPELLPLSQIAANTHGFTDLSVSELRTLAAHVGVDIAEGEGPEVVGDRDALIAALAKRVATAAPPAPAPAKDKPVETIVPAEISKLSDEDLETRAAELGLVSKMGWPRHSRKKKERLVAEASSGE